MSTTGWIVLGVIVVFVLWIIMIYNQLVAMRQRVGQSFSDIDVQLKQRLDLIPNLVEVVKGYASHEKGVFDNIANARAAMVGAGSRADKIAASNQLDGAISRLLVVSENYPQLKADGLFQNLQAQLEGTENRITVARNRYIQSVQDYNTFVRSFPQNITASLFGYKTKANFSVDNEKQISTAPTVDFSKPAQPAQQPPAQPKTEPQPQH